MAEPKAPEIIPDFCQRNSIWPFVCKHSQPFAHKQIEAFVGKRMQPFASKPSSAYNGDI